MGTEYEQMAAEYLEEQGYRIVKRNFYCRQGEIDIIAEDEEYLVFVEVKFRSSSRHGSPQEQVTFQKQRRISQAAGYYLLKSERNDVSCRFDVIAILDKEITHIKNAFSYIQ